MGLPGVRLAAGVPTSFGPTTNATPVSQFQDTDVGVEGGGKEVVNPAAKRTPGSPIYGMPILEVEKARVVIVCKRSLAAGFAGIDNELYYGDKTLMLFGDEIGR